VASADHDDVVFGSHELRASSFERANQMCESKKGNVLERLVRITDR